MAGSRLLKPLAARGIVAPRMKNRDRDAIALIKKGLQAAYKHLPAQAVEYLGQGLRRGASHFSYWYFYGVALGTLARYEEAGKALRKALQLAKGEKKSSTWSALADVLDEQGRLKPAERCHRSAVKAKFWDAGPWIRLGAFLAKRGRLDEALICHGNATTLREGAIDEAYLNLGNIYRAKGNYRLARKCFLKAIQLDPGYSFAKAALRDVAPLARLPQRNGPDDTKLLAFTGLVSRRKIPHNRRRMMMFAAPTLRRRR
jgi:tetratricopeptide (TPR) repeat protein